MLKGKIAVVTGAAVYENIGAGIARKYLENGATVICCDKDEANVKETANKLNKETGGKAVGIGIDITSPENAAEVLSHIEKTYGALDILVNCAGILKRSTMIDMEPSNFEATLKVNAYGTFVMTQAAAKIMKEHGGGRIINISSTSGKKPCRYEVAYGASKLAVLGITQVAALELGEYGIRVNAICPDATNCGMAKRDFLKTEEDIENFKKSTALGRVGTPEDHAKVALFLASELADHVTGAVIISSGGAYFSL